MEQIILMKEKFRPKNPKPSAESSTSILLATDEVVTNVACGALHTLVLTSKNRLLACGFGEGFALGTDDQATTAEFKVVSVRGRQKASPRAEKVEKICCGLAHSGCIIEGRVRMGRDVDGLRQPYVWGMMG
jgi:mitogen-activated protein kinase kinase kinase 9